MGSADAERRRIERDLHDGAQQRLVALALDLGVARDKFDGVPDRARPSSTRPAAEAEGALMELRDLVRGLHPARWPSGAWTARCRASRRSAPLPVRAGRPAVPAGPSSVEGVAYFIVSEALTNVGRHARASQAHW